ncbi:hypothetical protein KDN24_06515 [Bacillus sp. Bva_UNVM-123]|uniref:hypothetical protein n=1 Tax=Bacillus sp. Bva_UNVM-123 TaxID=2829798 RepID=UPI00391F42C9
MGVDTDGRISNKHGVKDIQRALKHKFNINNNISDTHSKDYYVLSFDYKGENRNLSVFENYVDDYDGKPGTHMSLGMWGSSIELMRGILEMYGGEIKENDCSDEWKYVSPSDKIHLSEEEILEDKLLTKLEEEEISYTTKKAIIEYVKNNLDFIKSL